MNKEELKQKIIKALKETQDYEWLHAHNGKAKYVYLQTVIDIVNEQFELASAEPREKRIAELEEINKELFHSLSNHDRDLLLVNDRIAELEAEVKEWKDKADLWCKTANLKDHNIMINKELEKENVQLKEKIRLMNEQEAKDIRSRFPC